MRGALGGTQHRSVAGSPSLASGASLSRCGCAPRCPSAVLEARPGGHAAWPHVSCAVASFVVPLGTEAASAAMRRPPGVAPLAGPGLGVGREHLAVRSNDLRARARCVRRGSLSPDAHMRRSARLPWRARHASGFAGCRSVRVGLVRPPWPALSAVLTSAAVASQGKIGRSSPCR